MGRSVTKKAGGRILGRVPGPPAASALRRLPRWWTQALLCALVLTAANAAKPIVIDDPVYIAYARQIERHPTDPYGFQLYWYDAPEPAMGIGTVPAVLPYWLAGAMRAFGDSPTAWKLSLLPFALALTGSLGFLLQRFAQPLLRPVLWTLALSPGVLPGFTLMLDVPAVALGLLGFTLCLRACELERASLALVAGLVLGLAMQTKYSAVVYPALALVAALLRRRPREGAIAALAAAGLFVGWEALLFAGYGQSHFLAGLERLRDIDNLGVVTRENARLPGSSALYWLLSLLSLLGSTPLYAALLALVGSGPAAGTSPARPSPAHSRSPSSPCFRRSPAFEPSGFLLLGSSPTTRRSCSSLRSASASRPAAPRRAATEGAGQRDKRRPERLLAAWLLLELVGFFVISPYPAVRRVIGLGIVATLLAARAAARGAASRRASAVAIATGFGLALAALFFASDVSDALVRRSLIDRVGRRLSRLGAPGRATTASGTADIGKPSSTANGRAGAGSADNELAAGDWLVMPAGVDQPRIAYPPNFQKSTCSRRRARCRARRFPPTTAARCRCGASRRAGGRGPLSRDRRDRAAARAAPCRCRPRVAAVRAPLIRASFGGGGAACGPRGEPAFRAQGCRRLELVRHVDRAVAIDVLLALLEHGRPRRGGIARTRSAGRGPADRARCAPRLPVRPPRGRWSRCPSARRGSYRRSPAPAGGARSSRRDRRSVAVGIPPDLDQRVVPVAVGDGACRRDRVDLAQRQAAIRIELPLIGAAVAVGVEHPLDQLAPS